VQQLKPTDKLNLYGICSEFLEKVDNNDTITSRLIFSDGATFHLLKRVNRHNLRICVSENPSDSFKHEWNIPKVSNLVPTLELEVHGQLFFTGSKMT
jgi:hypothetical protein